MSRWRLLLAIFFLTFSTVVIEILYTRVFSVLYYGSFAFLMISLALFGYGLSGVYLALSKIAKKENAIKYLERFILLFAITLPIIYKLALTAGIDFSHLFQPFNYKLALMAGIDFTHPFNPFSNFWLLVVNFLLLLVHFFLAGVSLVLIFSVYSSEIGQLYFIDLIGAAAGALAIMPLITQFGPARIMVLLSFFVFLGWLVISDRKKSSKFVFFIVLALLCSITFQKAENWFPLYSRTAKRAYMAHVYLKMIEYSKWSPMCKIDVSPNLFGDKKYVWIDGGTMEWIWSSSTASTKTWCRSNGTSRPYRTSWPGAAQP